MADWRIDGHGLSEVLEICLPCRQRLTLGGLQYRNPLAVLAQLVAEGYAREPSPDNLAEHPTWRRICVHSVEVAGASRISVEAIRDRFEAIAAASYPIESFPQDYELITVKFPGTISFGVLHTPGEDFGAYNGTMSGWDVWGQAEGEMEVPANVPTMLELTATNPSDIEALGALPRGIPSWLDVQGALTEEALLALSVMALDGLSVSLARARATANGWSVLRNWPDLLFLSLQWSNFGDDSARFLADHRSLRSLILSECEIGDAGMVQVAFAENLERLDLDRTRVSDRGLLHCLPNLQKLISLRLGCLSVTTDGLRPLMGHQCLEDLNLYQTQVGTEVTEIIGGIPSLRLVNLSGTRVDNSIVKSVRHLKHLRSLVLSDTRVSPRNVAKLRNLLPFTEITQLQL